MRVVVWEEAGNCEVLQAKDVAVPINDDQLLIEVYASSIHLVDVKIRNSSLSFYILAKVIHSLFHSPFHSPL